MNDFFVMILLINEHLLFNLLGPIHLWSICNALWTSNIDFKTCFSKMIFIDKIRNRWRICWALFFSKYSYWPCDGSNLFSMEIGHPTLPPPPKKNHPLIFLQIKHFFVRQACIFKSDPIIRVRHFCEFRHVRIFLSISNFEWWLL